jgi:hypothetical protein
MLCNTKMMLLGIPTMFDSGFQTMYICGMGNFNTQQQNMNMQKDAPLRDNNITLYLTRLWNGQHRNKMRIVFWFSVPCTLVEMYHVHSRRRQYVPAETSVPIQRPTQCYIPHKSNLLCQTVRTSNVTRNQYTSCESAWRKRRNMTQSVLNRTNYPFLARVIVAFLVYIINRPIQSSKLWKKNKTQIKKFQHTTTDTGHGDSTHTHRFNSRDYWIHRQQEATFLLYLGVLYEVRNRKHLTPNVPVLGATPINIALPVSMHHRWTNSHAIRYPRTTKLLSSQIFYLDPSNLKTI